MKFFGIVLLAVVAAVCYGIIHDQFTARLCIEYFTIAHPRLIESDSPTVLGLFWGIVATWWVGIGLGIPLALASRLGKTAKLGWHDHLAGIQRLLIIMAAFAALASVTVWLFTRHRDPAQLSDLTGERISPELRSRFLSALAAHLSSYGVGILGGLYLVVMTVVRRRRMIHDAALQRSPTDSESSLR